jgi:hypothetical protein
MTGRGALIAVAVVLVIAHGVILRFASKHLALSGAVASGLIALVVITHLGWLGKAAAMFRRKQRAPPT